MIKSASRSSITNDQKYRSMLAGTVPSNEYLISTTLLTQNEPSVTFSNLDQFAGIYKHLQIVYSARSDASNTARPLVINFNGNTGTSYTAHDLFNNGSAVSSSANNGLAYSFFGYITAAGNISGNFGAGVSDILDAFSATKNKTFRTLSGMTGTDGQIIINSGAFLNTSPISSLSIRSFSGNLATGSRFSLYGVTA